MRTSKRFINETLAQAQTAWGVPDWEITWAYSECDWEGDIELQETEKSAHMTLNLKNIKDQRALTRTIYHEVGHCVVWPIWRGMSDWVETYIGHDKARKVYEESVNTRENEVIDFVITRIFGL